MSGAVERLENFDEPGVINKDLLIKLAIEQRAKDTEARRLFLQDGIELDKITDIRIEFSNILKIDNVWIMSERLTRLKLSNNVIEKIENLDSLVNLRELDLSFNRIRIMENMDNLVKLEILLLYQNEISEIGGIERLTELTIFSIGANYIENWNHIMYLRKFDKLRIFNVAGNKCTQTDEYTNYLVAFLPQVEYLNYKMISDEERQIGLEKYHRTVANLAEKENIEKAEMEEIRKRKEQIAVLSLSYVEYLSDDELFQQMYKHDRQGIELSMINDETRTVYEEYKKIFIGLCFQLYEIGIQEHERRNKECELFSIIVDEGRQSILTEARTAMEKIIDRKTEIFGEITRLAESIALLKDDGGRIDESQVVEDKHQVDHGQRLSDQFNSLLSKTWTKLMYKEVILHEQIEDSNDTFERNMADMINSFSEAARAIFAQMRYAETEYKDNIDSILNLYINSFGDQVKMPSNHFDYCGDRDILNNNLSGSHDIHLQTIDAREDVMMSRLKNWYNNYMDHLKEEERLRNRRQILEISHFLESQREEFDCLQLRLSNNNSSLNAQLVAALQG